MGFKDGMSNFVSGVGQKAKGNYDIVAMNGKISNLQKEIQKMYLRAGQEYYSFYKENPDENMKEVVEEIKKAEEQIAEIKQQIESTKAETAAVTLKLEAAVPGADGSHGYCSKCGKPLAEGAKFCVHCGTKLE